MFNKSFEAAATYAVESLLPLPSASPTKYLAALHPVADLLAFIYSRSEEDVEQYLIEESKNYDEDYDRSEDE